MDLVGDESEALEVERKFEGILERGTGMPGNEVGNEVLLFAELLVEAGIFFGEAVEGLDRRLAHEIEHPVGNVFWCYFELAGNMVLHKIAEKTSVPVEHEIIEADAGADKYFLDPGQGAQAFQKFAIFAMVDFEVGAGGWGEAAPIDAGAFLSHFVACRGAKVGGGTSDIVDIAFEIGHFCKALGFAHNRIDAS